MLIKLVLQRKFRDFRKCIHIHRITAVTLLINNVMAGGLSLLTQGSYFILVSNSLKVFFSLVPIYYFLCFAFILKTNKEYYISSHQTCVQGYRIHHKGLENVTHTLLLAAQQSPLLPHLEKFCSAHQKHLYHAKHRKQRHFMQGWIHNCIITLSIKQWSVLPV